MEFSPFCRCYSFVTWLFAPGKEMNACSPTIHQSLFTAVDFNDDELLSSEHRFQSVDPLQNNIISCPSLSPNPPENVNESAAPMDNRRRHILIRIEPTLQLSDFYFPPRFKNSVTNKTSFHRKKYRSEFQEKMNEIISLMDKAQKKRVPYYFKVYRFEHGYLSSYVVVYLYVAFDTADNTFCH